VGSAFLVEQTSAAVTWSGKWNPSKGSYLSGGSAKISQTAGARATFSFTGDAVTWIAYKDASAGIARVYIDDMNTPKATVDTYSASPQAQAVAYTITGLPWGAHKIAIEATGTKNNASRGAYVWVDAFNYVGSPSSPATADGSASGLSPLTSIEGGNSIAALAGPALTSGSAQLNTPTQGGLALLAYKPDGITLTEAGIPASVPVLGGRIDAEVAGAVNTGVAISNPNDADATVDFFFTDANGNDSARGSFTLPARGQLSRFLDQSPFNAPAGSTTFTFVSNIAVAALAIRGITNERSEFLIATLPVANLNSWNPATITLPHAAAGGGWTTELSLVNPTDEPISGSVAEIDQNGAAGNSFTYSIPPRSSRRFTTPPENVTRVFSLQVRPDASNAAPVGSAVFTYMKDGVTVTAAGVDTLTAGSGFKLLVDASQDVRTGFAVANLSENALTVNLDVYGIDGTYTGFSGSFQLPASGQRAMFLDELQGLAQLPKPFKGLARISSVNGEDIAVTALRVHTNERDDVLISTASPQDETANTSDRFVFPHFVSGEGYSTDFIFYGAGSLQLYSPSGNRVQ
jgi:hypothetical protein